MIYCPNWLLPPKYLLFNWWDGPFSLTRYSISAPFLTISVGVCFLSWNWLYSINFLHPNCQWKMIIDWNLISINAILIWLIQVKHVWSFGGLLRSRRIREFFRTLDFTSSHSGIRIRSKVGSSESIRFLATAPSLQRQVFIVLYSGIQCSNFSWSLELFNWLFRFSHPHHFSNFVSIVWWSNLIHKLSDNITEIFS